MSEDYSLYEKIDSYLKGTLSAMEKAAFTQEMEQDESLRQKVELHEIANNVILTKQLLLLQGKIKQDLTAKKQLGRYKWILLSVALSAIIISGSIFLFKNKTAQKQLVESRVLSKDSIPVLSKDDNTIYTAPITSSKERSANSNSPLITAKTNDSIILIAPEKKVAPEPTFAVSKVVSTVQNNSDSQTKIDCSVFSFEDAVSTVATCSGEQNGKIQINTSKIKGGNAPYLFSISRKPTYKSDATFLYLNAGNYLLSVKDKNECVVQKEIEIEEKGCARLNAYAFSPNFEKWEIPFKQNKQGEIKIFNKSGILIYTSIFGNGHDNTWDGKSLEGNLMDSGYFVYILKYNDGEEERGSVTIRQ